MVYWFWSFDAQKKNCGLKENLRNWNSQMKSTSVDLETNRANHGDNKNNANLTKATAKIKNNKQI